MSTKIFVNLPVKDLGRSVEFFTRLGYRFNPQFTDETATCMIISDDIYVMLLTHEKFRGLTPKEICDTSRFAEMSLALSAESREAIDETVRRALAAGGSHHSEPEDYGWMYQHGFQDPDGHVWELVYMEPSVIEPLPEAV